MKSKKPSRGTAGVPQTRVSASHYRGPAPRMQDGSSVKGIMRLTDDSLPDPIPLERRCESAPEPSHHRRHCSFSCVDVRQHERVAGDNPCVSDGVPHSIGWGFLQHAPIDLDEYEHKRGPARERVEMLVPPCVRREMLQDEFGVTSPVMDAAAREVAVAKHRRRQTAVVEPFDGLVEVVQSAKRKIKRFVRGTSTTKEEEKMWAQAHQRAVEEHSKAEKKSALE